MVNILPRTTWIGGNETGRTTGNRGVYGMDGMVKTGNSSAHVVPFCYFGDASKASKRQTNEVTANTETTVRCRPGCHFRCKRKKHPCFFAAQFTLLMELIVNYSKQRGRRCATPTAPKLIVHGVHFAVWPIMSDVQSYYGTCYATTPISRRRRHFSTRETYSMLCTSS